MGKPYFFPNLNQTGVIDFTKNNSINIDKIHDNIFTNSNFEAQKQLAKKFILSIDYQTHELVEFVQKICQFIYQRNGMTTVQELTLEFGITRQDLNKIFKHHVKYTLKGFIIIVRVMAIIRYKINHPTTSFTALSYQFGYFDQAHFNYDFKRICGLAPSQFFKELPAFLYRHKS